MHRSWSGCESCRGEHGAHTVLVQSSSVWGMVWGHSERENLAPEALGWGQLGGLGNGICFMDGQREIWQ